VDGMEATPTARLPEQDAIKEVHCTSTIFSHGTLSVVQNLGFSKEERASVNSMISAIKQHIAGHVNEMVEQKNFWQSFNGFLVSPSVNW